MSSIGQSINSLNPSSVNTKNCINNAVPDILKPNCRMFQETQGIETSLLDPVVSRSDYIRWTLDRKGILHSNSKIKFSLKNDSGDPTSDKVFNCMSVGAKSFIKKCVLRCGAVILDQTENFNSLASYKTTFLDQEQVLRKEVYKSGVNTAIHAIKIPSMNGSGVADGFELPSEISYNTGRDFLLEFTANTGTNTLGNDRMITRVKDVANAFTLTDYVIDLHDLFNSLRFTQIPLYMCSQPVVIELFLETDIMNKCLSKINGGGDAVFSLDTSSPVLICDYIFYDAKTMADFEQQNSNLQLPFMEHKLINTTQNYNSNPNFVRNLGGANKQVNTITIIHTDLVSDLRESLNNKYFSTISGLTGDTLEINVKINDKFLYPVEIKNPMEQYVATFMAEGLPMNVSGRDYMKTQGVDFTEFNLIEGYDQDATLEGQKRYICLRNNTGERITNRGIELYLTSKAGALAQNKHYNQLVYLEIAKTLILKNGIWAEVYE